jgi:hypothetical protein
VGRRSNIDYDAFTFERGDPLDTTDSLIGPRLLDLTSNGAE